MHQIGPLQRPGSAQHVARAAADIDTGYGASGGEPLGQLLAAPDDNTLTHTGSRKSAHQQFGLAFAAAETAGEIDVGDEGRGAQRTSE